MNTNFPAPLDTLGDAERAIIEPFISMCRFPAGSQLLEAGAVGDSCYIIDEGLVRIDMADEQHVDDDQVFDFVEPGNILGKQSLLDRQPRSAHAFAHKDVVARRLDTAAIDELLVTHPQIAARILAALGRSASLKLRRNTIRLDNLLREPREPLVDTMIERACTAHAEIQTWPEERIDALLLALAQTVAAQAQELAAATVAETKIGNVRDKTTKNTLASLGVYQSPAGQPQAGLMKSRTSLGSSGILRSSCSSC